VYKSHREKAIYYIPGVKVLRPQIILLHIFASNFVKTDTKISSLFMLTAIKYHQGSSLKKSIKPATRRKYGYEKQRPTGHRRIQLQMVMNITLFLFTLTVLFEKYLVMLM